MPTKVYLQRDIDLARLAAFIDGEGCIDIYSTANKRKPEWTRRHTMRVAVANTDRRMIDWCASLYGGNVYKETGKRARPIYRWSVSSRKAEVVLKDVYPFLIIKQEQAAIALAFLQTFEKKLHPTPQEVLNKRDFYVDQIQRAKRLEQAMPPDGLILYDDHTDFSKINSHESYMKYWEDQIAATPQ